MPKEMPSPGSEIATAESEAPSASLTTAEVEKEKPSSTRTPAANEEKPPSSAITNHSTKRERLSSTRAKTVFAVLDKPEPTTNAAPDAHRGPQASAVTTTGTTPSEIPGPSTDTPVTQSKGLALPTAETITSKSKEPLTSYSTARTLTMDVERSSGLTESPVQSLFIFGHGGFQRVVLVFACVAVFVSYSQSFLLVVESHPVKYWCETNPRPASGSAESPVSSRHASVPPYANDSYGECTHFDPAPMNGTDNSTKVPCDHWEYDKSQSRSTIVAEWDLVCQRSRLKHLIWATFMTGGAVAVPTMGLTADVVGRRPVLIAAALLLLLSGSGVCLCESLLWFTVLRFLSGASTGALDVISTVLLFESTPAGPRGAFVAASVSLATCLSPVFVATVSAVFPTWRMLHAVLLVPALLLACLVFTIEESPHWCLYNNKFDDAERVALWAARLNLEDPDLVRDRLERIRKEAEFLGEQAVLRYPRLLRYIASAPVRSRCFALFGCWFFVYIAYYARDYWKLGPWIQAAQWFVVTGNFPAMAFAYALTRRHGGQRCAVPVLAACSLMSALQSVLVALGGRSSLLLAYCSSVIILNVAYVALVVHTVDAFPTPVRSLGYSGAFMSGRVGAMMGTMFRDFESMPLPANVLPTAVTSLGLLAFAASAMLVPHTPKDLFAGDASPFVRDQPVDPMLSIDSPMSWRVHRRVSPQHSPTNERE
ncbi:solute carrier family 22 member 8 [Rhipicephalus sanguineus]|uniref:solute carrier family 22 member 8 n=1 Tax=Rhipicephalus sanguineus TaxID=34632 RepID=UPI00189498A0|nr:solute carrier family 22 member 8 [Rhipicephalus sanguineus]